MFIQQADRKRVSIQLTVAGMAIFQCITSISSAEESDAQGKAPGSETTSPGTAQTPTVGNPVSAPESPPSSGPAAADPAAPASENAPSERMPNSSPAAVPSETAGSVAPSPPQHGETASVLPPAGQRRAGFAVEVYFGADKPLIAFEEELLDFNTISGGLFLGGKIGRVVVGLGFEMSRFKYRSKGNDTYYGDSSSEESAVTSLLFKPGVRFAILQSNDRKVDLFGQVDFGAGTIIYTDDTAYDDYDDEDEKYLLIDWDTGLGVRYWAHPQFAMSALGGLEGNYLREHYENADRQYSYHVMGIFGSLQVLGVF